MLQIVELDQNSYSYSMTPIIEPSSKLESIEYQFSVFFIEDIQSPNVKVTIKSNSLVNINGEVLFTWETILKIGTPMILSNQ